ncbi:MAG: polyprenyl synthetase family protein [Spirochaetales bacterium]|nr:polyprenyl synthetase family protein [Spirochaetales bacterium]
MDQYSERLRKIEEELFGLMPEKADASWLPGMTDSLSAEVPPFMIDRFHAPCLELLKRGGKRWRPLVMVLCCEASGGKAELAYPLTPLVEMPHNGSLIVDDIEDKSVERRGGPAVHLVHGEDLSINAGNLMYFNATALLKYQNDLDESLKYRILEAYCDSLRRLHFGQGLDIQWHNDHESVPDVPVYLQMCRFKTGALARFAAYAGCLAGGADTELCLKAAESWEKAGVGFQILDDVKNLTTGNPGKHRGDDIVEGKKSLPVILFHRRNPDDFRGFASLMHSAGDKGIETGVEDVEKAIAMLEDAGTIKEAGEKALVMLKESLSEIREIFPDKDSAELQCGIIESFIEKML